MQSHWIPGQARNDKLTDEKEYILSVCTFCLEHNPDRLEQDRYVKP